MQHPEPQHVDGAPLGAAARLNLRRLVHLVGRANRDAPDADPVRSAEIVLGAFRCTHHVKHGLWQPLAHFRVGSAVVRARECAAIGAAQAQVLAAALGRPAPQLLASLLKE